MKMRVLLLAIIALIAFSGCAQPPADTGAPSAPDSPPANGQQVDTCAGVTCPDRCDGTTSYYGGVCVNGSCQYQADYASEQCGFAPPATQAYNLQISMPKCIYDAGDAEFRVFHTIKNIGDKAPPEGSSVWLVGEGIGKSCHQIQNRYGLNQILWGEINHSGEFPYQGNFWKIRNKTELEAISYKLVFCEGVSCLSAPGTCTAANGEVWYEGSTSGCTYSE